MRAFPKRALARAKKKSSRSRYTRQEVESASHFATGSFRTIPGGRTSKVVIGCPKGRYSKKKRVCKTGTRAVSVLKRKRAPAKKNPSKTTVYHVIAIDNRTGSLRWLRKQSGQFPLMSSSRTGALRYPNETLARHEAEHYALKFQGARWGIEKV